MTSVLALLSVQPVLAEAVCKVNGQTVPCDNIPQWPFVIFFGLMAFLFLFLTITFIFWLWMLVDVIRNEKGNDLVAWFLVIFFFQLVGALIYYFARKKNREKETKAEDKTVASSDAEAKTENKSKTKKIENKN